jgi:hypothetical protein
MRGVIATNTEMNAAASGTTTLNHGGTISARMGLLALNGFVPPDYLVSPGEINPNVSAWNDSFGNFDNRFLSYDALHIYPGSTGPGSSCRRETA